VIDAATRALLNVNKPWQYFLQKECTGLCEQFSVELKEYLLDIRLQGIACTVKRAACSFLARKLAGSD
jgi:hypothetical protein